MTKSRWTCRLSELSSHSTRANNYFGYIFSCFSWNHNHSIKKFFSLCAKRKKGKGKKDIVHKWYKLGISEEVHDKLLFNSWFSIRKSVEKRSWYLLFHFIQVDPIAECTGSVTTIPTQTLRERIAARSPDRQHSGHDTCNEQPPDCHGVTSRHDDSSQAYCPCCHYKNHCCPDESTGAVR